MARLSKGEEALMTRRATRLAALQILYGQQFKGETLYQTDPYFGEAGEEGGDIEVVRSDRVFLAQLLSCARTHRRVLHGWLEGRIVGRSWGNVDLLLRLVLWLGVSEMILVSEGSGGLTGGDVRKGRGVLGRLAGEYCGIASLFYEDAGVLGLVNGVLDGASRSDLGEILRGEGVRGVGETRGDGGVGEGVGDDETQGDGGEGVEDDETRGDGGEGVEDDETRGDGGDGVGEDETRGDGGDGVGEDETRGDGGEGVGEDAEKRS